MDQKEYRGKKYFEAAKTTHFDLQRKIVANMTSESWETIPHAGVIYEPDVTDFMARFKELKSQGKLEGISINTLMLRVIVEGLKACPALNGHIEFNRLFLKGKIEYYKDINISMPMIMPDESMMTINLHNFESRSMANMQEYIDDVRRKLQNTNITEAMFSVSMDNTIGALKKLKIGTVFGRLAGAKLGKYRVKTLSGKAKREYKKIPESDRIVKTDIEQGTITISNLGSVYRGGATCKATLMEVIPPQIGAIGIGPVYEAPGVVDGEIKVRSYAPFLLQFDHRALDFGDVAPFMKKLDEVFANPDVIETL